MEEEIPDVQPVQAIEASEEFVGIGIPKKSKALKITLWITIPLVVVIFALVLFFVLGDSDENDLRALGEGDISGENGEVGGEDDIVLPETDCGIIDTSRIFAEDRTTEENSVLTCFSDSLATCAPALIQITGDGGVTYLVIEEGEGYCLTLGDFVGCEDCEPTVEAVIKTCKVPLSFIESSNTAAVNQGNPELGFVTVVASLTAGEVTDSVTGEIVAIECN